MGGGGGAAIRVAMVHGPGAPERDGVSDYVAHLSQALTAEGVCVADVPVRPAPRGGWAAGVLRAVRTIRRLRPDLVHIQFAPSAFGFSGVPGLLPLLLPRGTALVTTVHEYGGWATPSRVPPPVWRRLEARRCWDRETGRLVPASAVVVATNPGHAALVRARFDRRPVEIPLAPNVSEQPAPPDVRDRVRSSLGLPPKAFVLVFFGFVHPVKGVRYLLEALPALRAVRPDLHLLVIGGFTSQALPDADARAFRAELEALARRYRVDDLVTFTGHVPAAEVSDLLHAADAGVLPFTAGVTFKSGALLTLLAHGVPTAVSLPETTPGRGEQLREQQLRDGETVVVINARRNAEAIAACLRRLVEDEQLRRRLAAAGRGLVAGRSWPAVATAHRRVYERLVAGGRGE